MPGPHHARFTPTIKKAWPWLVGGILVLVAVGALIPRADADADVGAAAENGVTTRISASPSWTPTATGTAPPNSTPHGPASSALALLSTLEVKGRAPKTGYDRDLFGANWTDNVSIEYGHNGCDTRNDILRRDLVDITARKDTRDCVIQTGTLVDLYTGATIAFTRGTKTSDAVQIDHVVALSDAWQKGAQLLDAETRIKFANDPRNLQAVDGPTNQRKSDADASTWLPPEKSYRCTYVSRQVEVKAAYRLWVTPPERDAIAGVLASC